MSNAAKAKSKLQMKYEEQRVHRKYSFLNYLFISLYELFHAKQKYQQGYIKQFVLLIARNFRYHIRNPVIFIRFFASYTIQGLFCGSLFFRIKHVYSNAQNVVGALFFLQMVVSFPTASEITVRMFQAR